MRQVQLHGVIQSRAIAARRVLNCCHLGLIRLIAKRYNGPHIDAYYLIVRIGLCAIMLD